MVEERINLKARNDGDLKLLIFCLLLGICINACSRDEIMIFKEEQNSLNFPKYQYLSTTYKYDSLQFSSVFSGGKEVADFYIPIRVAGSVSDQDREYKLRVNPEETYGITENTHYTLETTHYSEQDGISIQRC